jgi:hypothetical protein
MIIRDYNSFNLCVWSRKRYWLAVGNPDAGGYPQKAEEKLVPIGLRGAGISLIITELWPRFCWVFWHSADSIGEDDASKNSYRYLTDEWDWRSACLHYGDCPKMAQQLWGSEFKHQLQARYEG